MSTLPRVRDRRSSPGVLTLPSGDVTDNRVKQGDLSCHGLKHGYQRRDEHQVDCWFYAGAILGSDIIKVGDG